MKELDVQELINQNFRLCTLLGIATSIIANTGKSKIDKAWFYRAIENVIYKNEPLPPFPD